MSKKSKNKMKAWRRMAKKYYDPERGVWVRVGRQLKMFTSGYKSPVKAIGLLGNLLNNMEDSSEILKRYEKRVKTDETK
jgi:hypothetical protein